MDQPWIARVVCAFPTFEELREWRRRLVYRLTHAGQWATPEWNLDPEPNMGPPWPEKERPT